MNSGQFSNVVSCLGKNVTGTIDMVKTAYNDGAMGKTQVYEWFSWFKKG